ncbi:hypothetical protein OHD62_14075 [Mesorhizobium sp. YC-39]|uniref:hypothetical protein n=1 Tax=unclassified Mesorhizobium TaxID=325217 RepID=UPI0021E75882|nr:MULTISPECIES: hypothetical protein [unclassified Mesorhizobium]MCV3207767.1 hypothetical protein [Mesorhizobium sp. YC-2]MCV3229494.1 hypothetical protein [Mesorhizobium sp. YC-39]
MTVSDMNRLEQAARVSMGGFQDPEASAAPHTSYSSLRIAIVISIVTIVLIAALQLG